MLRNRRFVVALVASCSLGALVLVAACADQGEGERCQLENGNNDCAGALVCTRSTDLPIAPNFRGQARDNEGRCCPLNRSQSSVAECAQTPPAPGGDAALPPVAPVAPVVDGATDSSTPDSAPDANGVDASTDASADAPTDANEAG